MTFGFNKVMDVSNNLIYQKKKGGLAYYVTRWRWILVSFKIYFI